MSMHPGDTYRPTAPIQPLVHRLFQPCGSHLHFPLLLLLIVLFSACASPTDRGALAESSPSDPYLTLRQPEALEPAALAEGKRLQVVASTSIIGDVVANVGGDMLEWTVLIPRGVDPHAYQPTPGDLQALYRADLVLLNGLGLEATLESALEPVSASVPVISLSEGLEPRTLQQASAPAEFHDEDVAGLDPHVWFDPTLVSHWVDRIESALVHLDPTHALDFQANADRYRHELETLDGWIQEQSSAIPGGQRKLVLDHLVLGYFADRYGFEIVSALVPAFSSAAESSAGELATLSEAIRTQGIPAIFVGVDSNQRLAEQLAGDLGIDVVPLYTGSLGREGELASTYIEMMQYNVLAIRQALARD